MTEPRPAMSFDYDHRGARVHWQADGDGPPVVLCHGTPWSSALWDPVATELARRWRVYRWDMLGYGRSAKTPDGDVSIAAQAELFGALLEHWNLDAPQVVAHDIGGAVVLRTHLLHHRAYRSLTLVDVVALAPWGSDFFRLVHDNAEVFQQLPAELHAALVGAYIRGASHRTLSDAEIDELSCPWLGADGQAAFYRQIAQADQRHTDEIEPLYPTLRIPTQLIWGAQDPWIPVERAHRLAAQIRGSRLTVVEHAGHLLQLEAPDELIATVTDFLFIHQDPRSIPG
jgi:pimeloyl-ACP methyl ester carboxylesterase